MGLLSLHYQIIWMSQFFTVNLFIFIHIYYWLFLWRTLTNTQIKRNLSIKVLSWSMMRMVGFSSWGYPHMVNGKRENIGILFRHAPCQRYLNEFTVSFHLEKLKTRKCKITNWWSALKTSDFSGQTTEGQVAVDVIKEKCVQNISRCALSYQPHLP